MIPTCEACGGVPVETGRRFCNYCLELSHFERTLLRRLAEIARSLGQIDEHLVHDLANSFTSERTFSKGK
jgi:hypothetical protein